VLEAQARLAKALEQSVDDVARQDRTAGQLPCPALEVGDEGEDLGHCGPGFRGPTELAQDVNSTMLADFVRDADGGITLDVQHDSPGKAREPNWLPAPEGPFVVVMRLYWPKAEALDGTWKQPPLKRVQ
jgi:hypothetical protein